MRISLARFVRVLAASFATTLVATFAHSLPALQTTFETKLVAPFPSAGENPTQAMFGTAVALSDTFAAVGEIGFDSPPFTDVGAVSVFERSSSGFGPPQRLVAQLPFINDNFGKGVALGTTSIGDVLLVGAPGRQVIPSMASGANAGSLFVFVRSGGSWLQTQELRAPIPTAEDRFGWSVAIDGDRLVVGAPGPGVFLPNPSTGTSGRAYVFELVAGIWSLTSPALSDVSGASGDGFGCSVTLEGDLIAVGALHDDNANGPDAGAVIPFHYAGGTWIAESLLTAPIAPNTGHQDEYGVSVSLSGSRLAVGAQQDDIGPISQSGAVYLHERIAGAWSGGALLTPALLHPGDWFGAAVALDGNRLAVASLLVNDPGTDSGGAYLFEFNGSAWIETHLHASDSQWVVSGSLIERGAIALSDQRVLLGAPQVRRSSLGANGPAYTYAGAAYTFAPSTGPIGSATCLGDGSGATCPCSNSGQTGAGCANSSGSGSVIKALGSASVSADNLVICATHVMPNVPNEAALLFVGSAQLGGGFGTAYEDGLLCAGGSLQRLGFRNLGNNTSGEEVWGPQLGAGGAWSVGSTRYFQIEYRNASGSFCPPGTLNLSNGLSVTFTP